EWLKGKIARRGVGLATGVEQVLGRAGDRVGRVVHVRGPVAVLVGGHAGHHLAGRVDRCAAPAVAGRAFDADLHRPGRAEAVLATVHAGQAGLAVVALHRADSGQDGPRHAVLLPDLLVPEQEVRRDRPGLGAGRRLPGGAGLLPGAAGARREERVRADQDGHGQQAEAHDGEQPDDADHQDPRRALLPGRALLGSFGADQELVRHDCPTLDSSMSLTCQLVPDPVTVTAYWALPLLVPLAVARCCVPVAMNVKLDGPKVRSAVIAAVPVDTCFWSVLILATPGVAYRPSRVVASWVVISPFILAT